MNFPSVEISRHEKSEMAELGQGSRIRHVGKFAAQQVLCRENGRIMIEAPPLVAIAIVNFNLCADTIECLESVRRIRYPNYLAVLVDNNSSDNSVGRIRTWASEKRHEGFVLVEYDSTTSAKGGSEDQERLLKSATVRNRLVLITSHENLGPTGGANLVIEYALRRNVQADYVFLLDNDAEIDANCLTALVELERKEKPGIAGAVVLDKKTGKLQMAAERTTPLRFFFRPLVRSGLPVPKDADASWETANANGPGMLIRHDVLETVYAARSRYLYDPHFRMGWEFEFCNFSAHLGYRVVTTRKAFVRHKGEFRYRQRFNASRHYYRARNYIQLAGTFLPAHWRLLYHPYSWALNAARVVRALLYGRPDVARATLEGVIDGYRGTTGKWKRQPR